jgi:hypothetical protein
MESVKRKHAWPSSSSRKIQQSVKEESKKSKNLYFESISDVPKGYQYSAKNIYEKLKVPQKSMRKNGERSKAFKKSKPNETKRYYDTRKDDMEKERVENFLKQESAMAYSNYSYDEESSVNSMGMNIYSSNFPCVPLIPNERKKKAIKSIEMSSRTKRYITIRVVVAVILTIIGCLVLVLLFVGIQNKNVFSM